MEAKMFEELVESIIKGGRILHQRTLDRFDEQAWKAHCEREWRKLKSEVEVDG